MKVLVTGGSTGLGKAIAILMVGSGYDCLSMPTREIISALNDGKLKEYIDDTLDGLKFDIIVNNFGINGLSWIGETDVNDANIMIGNTMTPYWVVNNQVAQGAVARVLNISSVTSRVPQRTTSIYCASKAAVNQMTRVMARELAPKGWIVNAMVPGKIIGTDMSIKTDEQVCNIRGWSPAEAEDYAKSLVPMGRFMTVDEAAHIAYDILHMPAYVNGSIIEACGGV